MNSETPQGTQDWIKTFYFKIISKTVQRIIATSSNDLGETWDPVWVLYYDGVNGTSLIDLYNSGIRSKDPTKGALGLSWNSRISLLDRDSFSKWYDDGITREKPRNVNANF